MFGFLCRLLLCNVLVSFFGPLKHHLFSLLGKIRCFGFVSMYELIQYYFLVLGCFDPYGLFFGSTV